MTETIPLLPETVYHIYNHANGDENLFRSNENYWYFLKKYGEYVYPIADTYAYCLMPNHFHLMIKIRNVSEILNYLIFKKPKLKDEFENMDQYEIEASLSVGISQQFSNFFNSYSKSFNKMYDRRGNLFIQKFKRKPVENEKYFEQLIAYIHLNPVKHGFCKNIMDWEHSSIHTYYSEKSSKLNRDLLQIWLKDKQGLIEFHEAIKIDENMFEF